MSPSSLPTCFGAQSQTRQEKKRTRREKKVEFDDDVVRRAMGSFVVECVAILKSAPLRVETAIFFKGEARFSKKNVGKLSTI